MKRYVLDGEHFPVTLSYGALVGVIVAVLMFSILTFVLAQGTPILDCAFTEVKNIDL